MWPTCFFNTSRNSSIATHCWRGRARCATSYCPTNCGTDCRGRGLTALTEKERLLVVILIGAELFHHSNDRLDVPEPGRGSEKATDEGFDLRRYGAAKRRSL